MVGDSLGSKNVRVALAFMRANSPDNIFRKGYRKLISWWTKGPYSHVEFVFLDPEDKRLKEFTADPEEGRVRVKDFEEDLNDYQWDFISFDLTPEEFKKFQKYMEKVLGDKYDWAGIFGFVAPTKDRENEWFCSEVTSNFLKILGEDILWKKDPSRISPNCLYKLASEMKHRNIKYNIDDMLKISLTKYNPKYPK